MKLKEIKRTAIQSWSPAHHHPIYLATGTSAQQLDASFSTNASLEFFELDLSEPTLDMKSCGSLSSSHRYHKLVWGPFGMDTDSHPSGVLIAGGENGNVILYDPARIMEGQTDVVIAESDLHTGPVRALDVNPFQTNLFASGGNDSEIYIWDMNNFGSPMTPGPKTQPQEDISCVAWNRQVQHILASASPSGRASVWDLRKNDLIIKVSDHSNRMHCSGLAWNPEVATQMVLSSEDDRMPVIQMWDLRFATSPLKVLEHHTRGVLALAWSLADPDLLLSCGKDNQILCWNPNTAEVLYELPTSSQWCFDIQWCPRNPAVLSAAGFDGHIDVYSIMGGSSQAQSQRHADQISNSFGNMDPFGTGQVLPPLQLPQTSTPPVSVNPLKKPPKWIRRPVGASFAFGGKLVSLENSKPDPQQVPQSSSHVVHVSQVVTETDFLRRSEELQATLSSGGFVSFCQGKIESAENQFEKTVWSFLKANFESDVRGKYLELLGYNKEELALKVTPELQVEDLTAALELMLFLLVYLWFSDVDGLITQALLTGDFEGAVELCLHDNRMADSIILAIAGGAELLEKTQKQYFTKTHGKISKLISAVVMKDWTDILRTCDLQSWKEALAGVMTYAKTDEFSSLCDLLGGRLEEAEDPELNSQACLSYICAGNVERLVSCWSRAHQHLSPLSLQDLVEKVVILRQAVEQTQRSGPASIGLLLAERMSHYAGLLASQGSLSTAISYLPDNSQQVGGVSLLASLPLSCLPAYSQPGRFPHTAGAAPVYHVHHYSSPSSSAVEPSSPPPPHPPPAGFLSHYTSQPPPLYPGPQCPSSLPSSFYSSSSSSSSSGAPFQNVRPGSPMAYTSLPPPPHPPPASGTQTGPDNELVHASQSAELRPAGSHHGSNHGPPGPWPSGPHGTPGHRSGLIPRLPATTGPSPYQPRDAQNQHRRTPGGTHGRRDHSERPVTSHTDALQNKSFPERSDMIPQNLQSIPAEKITKKPIPEEHVVLKTTFEGLIHKCLAVASDPQTKRKLDDANKRLEVLYDKLREQTLSPSIVGGLHSMARSMEARCYADGLNIHTHIVSSSNFSETSAFMPVLKVVLTQANKLGV
uniref:Protein transport protein Sec31A n=1 Tax=Gouania willdenowi TaxID=441366 RepID=A0A8C5D773_GOUWI